MGLAEASKEEVTVKGTGRAIEKVLGIAAWFGEREKEEGVRVRMGTHSITSIDDIVMEEKADVVADTDGGEIGDDIGEAPESRLRQVSVLEVKISLR
jgi:Rpp20 subunit of nuclear RNase MRP and P